MVAPQTLPDTALTCYALPPLSLTLLSGELSVRPYRTGQNPPLGDEPALIVFDAVDLDLWLTTFLGAVEALLTTEYAAAAEVSHAASLTAVREAKLRLAAILADRALPLFADAPGTTEARALAVDALITMLLKSLVDRAVVAGDGPSVRPPHCVYPDPVTLISQQAVQSVAEPVSAADLTSWQVSVQFEHSGSDSYVVDAAFNTCPSTENDASLVDDSLTRLFRALGEFVTAWPMLADDLAVLPTLTDGGTDENATIALRAFAMLVDTVTSALAVCVPAPPDSDPPRVSAVTATEGTCRAEIGGLNVLRQASALAGVAVVRNAELLPGRVTNPAFVYRGPCTRFSSEVVPVVRGAAPIDIAVGTDSVGAALGTFLRALLGIPDFRPVLRLAATFSESAIPILLLPSVTFRPADWDWTVPGTVVSGVDDMVSQWLEAQDVSAGTIRFDLSVFGGDGRPKPLIRDVTLLYPLRQNSA